jgi:hypothetical protein
MCRPNAVKVAMRSTERWRDCPGDSNSLSRLAPGFLGGATLATDGRAAARAPLERN